MFYRFKDFVPVVHPTAYVHPQAVVTGNVVIGAHVYIGPGAALRGDWGGIHIEEGANVQENCTIHMFPGVGVRLEASAHIGHGAIIHGAHIGRNVLVGMNAVILDEAVIGEESIIGALTLIKAGMQIPRRSLVVGNPGKIIRELGDEMVAWKTEGTAVYQALPQEARAYMEPCEPLSEIPEHQRGDQESGYRPWKSSRPEKDL